MAVTGTFIDHMVEKYRDTLIPELQKDGSRLEGLFNLEQEGGVRVFFDKIGKAGAPNLKTQRAADKVYVDPTFERRFFEYQAYDFNHILDKDDMTRYVSDPTSDIVQSAKLTLGRKKDEILFDALTGSANVKINGSSTTTSITTTIAVNDHDYDPAAGTNDIGLTDFKLRKAKKALMAAYADAGREPIYCLAPASQLAILSTFAHLTSGDFRSSKPLDLPGLDAALSGFLGITFIHYEDTGNTNTTDENVYLFTRSSLKGAYNMPLTVEITKNTNKSLNPFEISVWESLGAVRMHDEAVIKIVCDPAVSKSA